MIKTVQNVKISRNLVSVTLFFLIHWNSYSISPQHQTSHWLRSVLEMKIFQKCLKLSNFQKFGVPKNYLSQNGPKTLISKVVQGSVTFFMKFHKSSHSIYCQLLWFRCFLKSTFLISMHPGGNKSPNLSIKIQLELIRLEVISQF